MPSSSATATATATAGNGSMLAGALPPRALNQYPDNVIVDFRKMNTETLHR